MSDDRTLMQVRIRWMIKDDLPAVLEIERGSFEIPWDESHFIEYLRRSNVIGHVAEHDGDVVGFMIYTMLPKRLEVASLAVSPLLRRRGVGVQMIEKLRCKLSADRRTRLCYELSERNRIGAMFLRRCGFKAAGVVRAPYVDMPGDAFVYEYKFQK